MRQAVARKAWDTVGRLGEELGCLARSIQTTEIFHFEWRPTLSGRPKVMNYKTAAGSRKGGNQAVWELLGTTQNGLARLRT